MPLKKDLVYRRFNSLVANFIETPESLFVTHKSANIVLQKSSRSSTDLQAVALFFPLDRMGVDPDLRSLIGIFWAAVLPENTHRKNYWEKAVERIREQGSYEEWIGDIYVSLLQSDQQCRLQALVQDRTAPA